MGSWQLGSCAPGETNGPAIPTLFQPWLGSGSYSNLKETSVSMLWPPTHTHPASSKSQQPKQSTTQIISKF